MNSVLSTMSKLATTQLPKFQPLATVLGTLQHQLYACGLYEDVVIQITDAMVADPSMVVMAGRWQDEAAGYPPQLLVVGWSTAKLFASNWLKQHAPMHVANFVLAEDIPLFAVVT